VRALRLTVALVGALAAACGGSTNPDPGLGSPDASPGGLAAAPDFALVDTNATSPTYQDAVSPRDMLQRVSGWYFTHAS
jgi:hypothetical protein